MRSDDSARLAAVVRGIWARDPSAWTDEPAQLESIPQWLGWLDVVGEMRRGAVDEAIAAAQSSLRLDVLQEPMHRTLMRLYLQSGDVVEALQQYETCAKALKRELRVEPDAETKALQREIAQLRARGGGNGKAEPAQKSVLVVEDNVLSRELMNALLKSAGYSVIVA
jgi:hypothetical protein